MARLWFLFGLLLAENVLAISEYNNKPPCDSCIGTGRLWCRTGTKHCLTKTGDKDSCPVKDVEEPDFIIKNTDGDLLQPMYAERTLSLREFRHQKMTVTYASSTARNVTIDYRNQEADLGPKIDIQIKHSVCTTTNCTVDILAKPDYDFCSFYKSVEIVLKIDGIQDEATIKYHVPCSCKCSEEVEISSPNCSGHGNNTCGLCTCEPEWTGDNCDQCIYDRGDIEDKTPCTHPDHNEHLECSGNGKCNCGKCTCNEDLVGSQYFDSSDKCTDICMRTSECHSCLRNGTLGDCPCENKHMQVISRNETLAATEKEQFDGKLRNLWVHCKETADNCDFDYYAMMTEGNRYSVMINSNCNDHSADSFNVASSGTNVPLIIGIVGIIAAIATVGGILLWKHMNALPPLPMTDPQYANIDAEDCTGENPLYKPPTSSFKNPTYGKW